MDTCPLSIYFFTSYNLIPFYICFARGIFLFMHYANGITPRWMAMYYYFLLHLPFQLTSNFLSYFKRFLSFCGLALTGILSFFFIWCLEKTNSLLLYETCWSCGIAQCYCRSMIFVCCLVPNAVRFQIQPHLFSLLKTIFKSLFRAWRKRKSRYNELVQTTCHSKFCAELLLD